MDTKQIAKKAVDKVVNGKMDHSEGEVARTLENQTARLPSDVFLWGGLGCLAASAILTAVGQKALGRFIGQVAAPILIMGLYNKLVKLEGSDRYSSDSFYAL